MVLAAAERGALEHFAIDRARLDPAADYVIETIRANYPSLDVPLSQPLAALFGRRPRPLGGARGRSWAIWAPDEMARIRFDLVVTSVLLDAGAGDAWRYRRARHRRHAGALRGPRGRELRSVRGRRPARPTPAQPLRADADGAGGDRSSGTLGARVPGARRQSAGRARRPLPSCCSRLGETRSRRSRRCSARAPRIGGLFDHLAGQARGRPAGARDPGGGAGGLRRDLARPDRACRRQSRRRRPPSRRRRRRPHRRPRAVPQALAVARLLADRAAARTPASR